MIEPPEAFVWDSLAPLALEYANDAMIVCECLPAESRFVIRYVNTTFEEQTGYGRAEVLGRDLDVLYGPLTNRDLVAELTSQVVAMKPVVSELRKYRKDGTPFWAEISARPVPGRDGSARAAIVIQRDVTERIEAEGELELLSAAIDCANDGIVVFQWDRDGERWLFRHVNETFLAMTGYEIGEVIGATSDLLIGELTDVAMLRDFREKLFRGEAVRGEFAFYRKDGTHVWAELNGRGLLEEDGGVTNTIVVYRDVTEHHEREDRLSFEAAHDALTGVFNRRFFIRSLEAALHDARRRAVAHALLFFDLDGFKPINDTHGHEAGDRLLVELTSEIGGSLRHGDVLGRLGGDEFAILLYGCLPSRSESVASEILEKIRDFRLLWEGRSLRVGASLGVVCVDRDSGSAADVMRRADEACYAAKNAGRNRIVIAAS